jgi:hypothetical protein
MGVGERALTAAGVLAPGTKAAQIGRALGEIVGGWAALVTGGAGGVGGGVLCATGVGAAAGAPVLVGSAALVVGGVGNMAAGIQGLAQALTTGGGSAPSGRAIRISPNWKPRTLESQLGNGCEGVAKQIQKLIGGDIIRITSPIKNGPLGRFKNVNMKWSYHEVVVKDGRVYDAFTGHTGVPIDEYKKLWEFGDALLFGF